MLPWSAFLISSSVGLGLAAEERRRAHQHPRRAVAALERVVRAERLLERGQLAAAGQTLDRLDARAVGLDGEHHAALDEHAVDDHRAGAAVARVAADVAAGEVEVVADEVDQQLPRLDLALVDDAVDGDGDHLRGRDRGHSAPLQRLLRRALRQHFRQVEPVLARGVDVGRRVRPAPRTAARTASRPFGLEDDRDGVDAAERDPDRAVRRSPRRSRCRFRRLRASRRRSRRACPRGS